ncbi:hypothetical protein [Streptomyces tropicalis]|uniref:DUF8094 domain-containing protein n=1 Tax=Streptomyces tropicalis TaxID=3034234 RepID=A0ABT6A0A4_9ACTN|nr:hypothetical protein [Streptomyces tropicalis]MDF3297260.1 hypothetical protein [Streptomyces tropicalis]
MSRVRGPRRPRRRERRLLAAVFASALSLTASGCVVVHGEREVLPAATRTQAAAALTQFTAAYNKADRAYDSSLDAGRVTGALAAIDAARLKAGHANHPAGNPAHTPLELTDAKFTIPKKAGWPRWFLADARGNKGGDVRWLLVFTRSGPAGPWQVAFLTLVAPGDVPGFAKDADGWARAVPADSAVPAVAPRDLSASYATYLHSGGGAFAPGPHTTGWRALRTKDARRPGLATQYIDQPLTDGDYAPLALRTADGGALVFFATHHYEKQTAAAGAAVPTPNQDVQALTTGEVKQSLTMEFVSNEVVLDPVQGAGRRVSVLGRIQGLTGAQGE